MPFEYRTENLGMNYGSYFHTGREERRQSGRTTLHHESLVYISHVSSPQIPAVDYGYHASAFA